jgi:hypothetical protein
MAAGTETSHNGHDDERSGSGTSSCIKQPLRQVLAFLPLLVYEYKDALLLYVDPADYTTAATTITKMVIDNLSEAPSGASRLRDARKTTPASGRLKDGCSSSDKSPTPRCGIRSQEKPSSPTVVHDEHRPLHPRRMQVPAHPQLRRPLGQVSVEMT